jgi:hypothetical protein
MRKCHLLLSAAVAGLLGSGTLAFAPAAEAATTDATGAEFGQHVSECAQTMGFSGDHNPGMHQGFAGWDGMPCG